MNERVETVMVKRGKMSVRINLSDYDADKDELVTGETIEPDMLIAGTISADQIKAGAVTPGTVGQEDNQGGETAPVKLPEGVTVAKGPGGYFYRYDAAGERLPGAFKTEDEAARGESDNDDD